MNAIFAFTMSRDTLRQAKATVLFLKAASPSFPPVVSWFSDARKKPISKFQADFLSPQYFVATTSATAVGFLYFKRRITTCKLVHLPQIPAYNVPQLMLRSYIRCQVNFKIKLKKAAKYRKIYDFNARHIFRDIERQLITFVPAISRSRRFHGRMRLRHFAAPDEGA